ncbi:hypothetical protein H8356DRAFT_1334856 [Neocallimastix lanati (nom. inval.)]|nr:hypothetical protein H8356DRAFT_1334856 [Neocallimastix sp. JGI-2020a]
MIIPKISLDIYCPWTTYRRPLTISGFPHKKFFTEYCPNCGPERVAQVLSFNIFSKEFLASSAYLIGLGYTGITSKENKAYLKILSNNMHAVQQGKYPPIQKHTEVLMGAENKGGIHLNLKNIKYKKLIIMSTLRIKPYNNYSKNIYKSIDIIIADILISLHEVCFVILKRISVSNDFQSNIYFKSLKIILLNEKYVINNIIMIILYIHYTLKNNYAYLYFYNVYLKIDVNYIPNNINSVIYPLKAYYILKLKFKRDYNNS